MHFGYQTTRSRWTPVMIALLLAGGAASGWGLRPATHRIIRIEHDILDVLKKRPQMASVEAGSITSAN